MPLKSTQTKINEINKLLLKGKKLSEIAKQLSIINVYRYQKWYNSTKQKQSSAIQRQIKEFLLSGIGLSEIAKRLNIPYMVLYRKIRYQKWYDPKRNIKKSINICLKLRNEKLSLQQIGNRLNLSRERIRQILSKTKKYDPNLLK